MKGDVEIKSLDVDTAYIEAWNLIDSRNYTFDTGYHKLVWYWPKFRFFKAYIVKLKHKE